MPRKSEAPAEVYNKGYMKGGRKGVYFLHYTESPYYKCWKEIWRQKLLNPKDRILDLGCGPGQFGQMCKDRGVVDYRGVDFSNIAIAQAKVRVPEFSWQCKDIYKYKVPECDVIVALEVLEHLARDIRLLQRLPKGRRFVCTVPNFDAKNHVRFFPKRLKVEARYSRVCNIEGISRVPMRHKSCLWIFHGTLKGELDLDAIPNRKKTQNGAVEEENKTRQEESDQAAVEATPEA